jgi:hypothetical protein
MYFLLNSDLPTILASEETAIIIIMLVNTVRRGGVTNSRNDHSNCEGTTISSRKGTSMSGWGARGQAQGFSGRGNTAADNEVEVSASGVTAA